MAVDTGPLPRTSGAQPASVDPEACQPEGPGPALAVATGPLSRTSGARRVPVDPEASRPVGPGKSFGRRHRSATRTLGVRLALATRRLLSLRGRGPLWPSTPGRRAAAWCPAGPRRPRGSPPAGPGASFDRRYRHPAIRPSAIAAFGRSAFGHCGPRSYGSRPLRPSAIRPSAIAALGHLALGARIDRLIALSWVYEWRCMAPLSFWSGLSGSFR